MPGRISKVPLLTFSCLLALPLHHSMAQTDSTQAKYGITQEQYQYVLTESAKGGKLDFEAQMGEKYFVLIDSIAYNRRSGAAANNRHYAARLICKGNGRSVHLIIYSARSTAGTSLPANKSIVCVVA